MAGQVFNKVVEFFTPNPYPPLCPMPGCNKQCYVENNGHVHDFCGKTHAREYKAMKDAQKQQRMMRDKRLKAVQHGQSSGAGGHGGGGWQGQQSYSMAVACGAGPSCTRSGIPYGAYSQPTMMTNHYGDVGHGPIRFYNRDEPYYEFTNFYPAPIDLDGTTWPTTEHYFQAQKFIGTSYPEVIRQFDRPRQAFDLSRNPAVSPWRRKDWEDIKIDIMRKALLAKFTQHKHLRQLLLRTGDRYLIEHSPHDKFWGNGGDDSGGNHLGLLLMEVRQILINLQASLYKQEETVVRVQPHITPDSHRERIQRSESTEKDGQNGLSSSSSSCSMDYTNAGADQSNQNQQNNSTHPDVNNSDDLTRPPLHPVATENTGSPPCQPLAATVGGGSPQVNTPVPITNASATPSSHDQSTSRPTSDPPVGDLINFKDAEPSEEDKVTPMITGGVPKDLAKPLQPMPPAPGPIQCTTHAGRYVSSDTSTDAGKEPASSNEDNHSEKMETDDSNHIH